MTFPSHTRWSSVFVIMWLTRRDMQILCLQHAREPDENIAPPPLPSTEPPPLDPDYEVIEFPGQAYTNAPLPTKPTAAGTLKHRQLIKWTCLVTCSTVPQFWKTCELWTEKDAVQSSCGLFWNTMSVFSCRNWENHEKPVRKEQLLGMQFSVH